MKARALSRRAKPPFSTFFRAVFTKVLPLRLFAAYSAISGKTILRIAVRFERHFSYGCVVFATLLCLFQGWRGNLLCCFGVICLPFSGCVLFLSSFPGLTRESRLSLVEGGGVAGLDPRIKSGGDVRGVA
ncbi:hypothetical protein [Iodidimonas gelatinilytica]|uniref:hypothetical protein n=1 Tax=Iodidimonas gelatinilytica TaxID=1236966 RepID=UPI0012316A96|nr:hypothetical protein [Iodidimonas gelatinilytica]